MLRNLWQLESALKLYRTNSISVSSSSNIISPLARERARGCFFLSSNSYSSTIYTHNRSMSSSSSFTPGWNPIQKPFPPSRRSDHVDLYQSKKKNAKVEIKDPYQWLENPSSENKETREWTERQAQFTNDYLNGIKDEREKYQAKLSSNFSYPRFSCPSRKGDASNGLYYYSFNSGLDPQSTIYVADRQEVESQMKSGADSNSKETKPIGKKWFDQNLLSQDHTSALTLTSFSPNGKLFAYGISNSGSDWFTIYFRETSSPFVDSKVDSTGGPDRLNDVLENVKFSGVSWLKDNSGVFYQTYPSVDESKDKGTETDENKDAKLWFHRIGTDQKDDILVIDKDVETPTSMWSTEVTDDGKWLIVSNNKDTDSKARTFIARLENGNADDVSDKMKWIPVATEFKSQLDYVGNDEERFVFMTNDGAPNSKLVSCQISSSKAEEVSHPSQLKGPCPEFKDFVPEDPKAKLSSASLIDKDKLLLVYSRDVKDELWQFDWETGKKLERRLSDLVGTISQISGRRKDSEAFVSTVSFINPGTITRLTFDKSEEKSEQTYLTTKVPGINPDNYVSEQVWFSSKDGTKVPMFVTRLKETKLDGKAPGWVYFYGGFNIPIGPVFSPSMMTWLTEYSGVLAFVNARGGGEYGDAWHEAGRLFNKQNVFDDALSACKYLHENKYVEKGKIILNGGSNGGLGVAACLNQATEEHGLGAGIAEVGVMDMLKFHKFTIGRAWTSDYGNPDDPEAFDYLLTYSPLHNVSSQKTYPLTVLCCADHDDRVVPAHTFKLTAELQHQRPQNENPILLRVELKAGHGSGKSTQKRIEEAADKVAIVSRALGLKMRDSAPGSKI